MLALHDTPSAETASQASVAVMIVQSTIAIACQSSTQLFLVPEVARMLQEDRVAKASGPRMLAPSTPKRTTSSLKR